MVALDTGVYKREKKVLIKSSKLFFPVSLYTVAQNVTYELMVAQTLCWVQNDIQYGHWPSLQIFPLSQRTV